MKVAFVNPGNHIEKSGLLSSLASAFSGQWQIALIDLDIAKAFPETMENNDGVQKETVYKSVPQFMEDSCTQCSLCEKLCNFGALKISGDKVEIRDDLCTSCSLCVDFCPELALQMVEKESAQIAFSLDGSVSQLVARINPEESFSAPLLKRVNERLNRNFMDRDVFFIDAPSSNSYTFRQSVDGADVLILLINGDYWSARALRNTLLDIRAMDLYVVAAIIGEKEGRGELEDFCRKEYLEVAARIKSLPDDEFDRKDTERSLAFLGELSDLKDFLEELYLDLSA